jgi:FkbM family methyltransferase
LQSEQYPAGGSAEGHIDQIVFDRFFAGQSTGTCIEIGAARPDWLSIGALFRSKGWDVIAVEPNPTFADMHRSRGHTILQFACGDHDQDDVDFSVVDSHKVNYRDGAVTFESWSSLSIKDDYAELNPDLSITKIKVKLRRLDSLLAENRPTLREIDLIAVDVEGWELNVLEGLDFSRYSPRVVIIENLFHKAEYRKFMQRRGYTFWRCSPPNDVYVRLGELSAAESVKARAIANCVTQLARTRTLMGRFRRRVIRAVGRTTSPAT